MQKTFSYVLKCTTEQSRLLSRIAGSTRYIYNYALGLVKEALASKQRPPHRNEMSKMLTQLKKAPTTAWLKEPPSQILQQALIDLERALKAHYSDKKNKVGFPTFRKRGRRDSFRFPQWVSIEGDSAILPKIGPIKIRYSRPIEGTIKQATIKRSHKSWHINIVCLIEKEVKKIAYDESGSVGIDLGLLSFATLSNGLVIPNPRFLAKALKKLRYYQRAYSRTQKGSKNREKARVKLARQHEKIKNQRKDFLHKVTTMLVKNHDCIMVEDLSVKNMMQNRKLARSISDVGWYLFRNYLHYKCDWYGKHLVVVDKFEPTSKKCSFCKTQQVIPLSRRTYSCQSCHAEIDRDLNASLNIRSAGMSDLKARGEWQQSL